MNSNECVLCAGAHGRQGAVSSVPDARTSVVQTGFFPHVGSSGRHIATSAYASWRRTCIRITTRLPPSGGQTGWPLKPHLHRSCCWCESGVIVRIFRHLASDHDNDYMLIDSTIVWAHQHGAGPVKKGADQAIGRSRGALTSKLHAIVDAAGKAVVLSLTPGQGADITEAGSLLDEGDPEACIADKPYDADPLIKPHRERQITAVIPSGKKPLQSRGALFLAIQKEK